MANETFQDSALVLIGHGSTVNAASSAPTYQHAAELRQRGLFSEVLECFWKIEPRIRDVLQRVNAKRVFIVPLFISEGYFTTEIIPRELGLCRENETHFDRIQHKNGKTLHYCGPVGTHPGMTDVLLQRAREVVEKHPFPRMPKPADTTLFIAGHGTGTNENSRKAIEHQVNLIRERKLYAEVYPAFMEESPRIEECHKLAATRNIVMVPFFISDGLHTIEDIPELLGEPKSVVEERMKNGQPTWRNPTEKNSKLVWYSRSIGSEPMIADVILERVRESAG